MKRTRRGKTGLLQATASFVLGAVTGAIVALLYAPTSGQVARRRLAMKARGLQRTAVRRLGRAQRALATKAEHVREAAAGWMTERFPVRNGRHPIRHRAIRHAAAR
ncbi:MAG: YtxH domain-containing protein [Candidatus Omnitrophica bacterium]|nr:YtxH domain-containing protein [Candidatus Omnitrophota bacterium]